jgi:CRP-like cAMP-binding protein
MSRATSASVAAVRAAPLFSALDESAVQGLLQRCPVLKRPAGAVVFTPAERAERFYVVLSGRVKLYKLSPKGDEQILHLYGAGHSFAEAAVLGGGEYPAFAEVVEDATLLAVRRSVLAEAITANPELAMGMLAGLSAKLREFNRLIEELSLKEVPARLAAALLRQSEEASSATFRLKQTKRQLAAQIGTVAETLSRALRKLKQQGLIDVRGSQVTIRDHDRLGHVAENG